MFGNSCGGTAFIEGPEKQNVAALLKAAQPDYSTFYAGKYLNNYGAPQVGGVARIPPGWDEWYGLVGNSKYYDYSVSNNGVEEKHGNDYAQDYFTDRVANRSVEFMQSALSAGKPFFMQVATPASHEPNTPAPQYNETYAGMRAPRLPSYNVTGQKDKNFLLRDIIPMNERHANVSDVVFQRRWSTLRSVDDMVGRFLAILSEAGQLANTFIIYSSDHGCVRWLKLRMIINNQHSRMFVPISIGKIGFPSIEARPTQLLCCCGRIPFCPGITSANLG